MQKKKKGGKEKFYENTKNIKQQQEIKQLRNKIRRNVTSISCSKRAIKLNRRETKIRFLILPSSPYSTVLKRERIISRSLLLPSLVISLINRVVRLRQRREDERRKTSSITREENTLAGIQRREREGISSFM